MKIKDFFVNLYKRIATNKPAVPNISAININGAGFTTWHGNFYENDIYRAGVDAIARNAAKLKGVHTVTQAGERQPVQDSKRLQRILQTSPNIYMSAFDALYKIVSQYYLNNNAFALLDFDDKRNLQGYYPINYVSADFQMDNGGNLYVEFTFKNGRKAQFPYSDLIHIRRHFNKNEFLGDDNRALNPAMELAQAQNEGIITSIKSGFNLRGILKTSKVNKSIESKQIRNDFIKDYMSMADNGGIAILDNSADYIPLNQSATTLDNAQITATKNKIFDYLGISDKIVNSTYSENDFSAFYESVIEPIATQLSLEFTRKIFTDREQALGNQIIFESGRLQFSSNTTKINLIKELLPLGLLSINQALEILNIAPIENGDKRLQTLNVVDFDKANEYQMLKAGYKYGNKAEYNPDDGDGDNTAA